MATKIPKKKEPEISLSLPVEEYKPLLEEHKEPEKKSKLSLTIPGFTHLNALMKLRITITILFVLFTLAILLIFANGWMISAALLLISYILLLMLMIKLFRTKNL